MTEMDVGTSQSFTQQEVQKGANSLQFATFYLESEPFGINILQVQEILLKQNITPVPLAEGYVLGLISLRGQIVTAVDLKRRLGKPTTRSVADPYQIVVKTGGLIASFQVDQIGDVIEVAAEEIKPPPESISQQDARFLEGVYPMENEILSILNVEAVLATVSP